MNEFFYDQQFFLLLLYSPKERKKLNRFSDKAKGKTFFLHPLSNLCVMLGATLDIFLLRVIFQNYRTCFFCLALVIVCYGKFSILAYSSIYNKQCS